MGSIRESTILFINIREGAWRRHGPEVWACLATEEPLLTCHRTGQRRQFDRILGDGAGKPSAILYADISHPGFAHFHKILSDNAKAGKSSYRLRYKPSVNTDEQPLPVNGYGVELALKRTDYIVIDDRDAEVDEAKDKLKAEEKAKDGASDLRPLSVSELRKLGLKTSSFIMSSADKLNTLSDISKDFPKHSSAIAAHNVSEDFLKEFYDNRRQHLPAGYNVAWMNGAQVDVRQFDAFAWSQRLRRERRMINAIQSTGLSSSEAIKLLSYPDISASKSEAEVQRYDYRDEIEGGQVIIWLNDVEKDKRYEGWPTAIGAYLQRMYPGQLPTVRRDLHNLVIPVDLTDADDVLMILEQLQEFVKRKVPMRFGLVPIMRTAGASTQAKAVYHLSETYGLAAVLSYLQSSLTGKRLSVADTADFDATIKDRKLRIERTPLTLSEVLSANDMTERIEATQYYINRLGADTEIPPFFINGVALPRDEAWLAAMRSRLTMDLQSTQQAIFEEKVSEDTWLPSRFLADAATRRNMLIIPLDEDSVKFIDVAIATKEHKLSWDKLPILTHAPDVDKLSWDLLIVVADLTTDKGFRLMQEAVKMRQERPGLLIKLLHNSQTASSDSDFRPPSRTGSGEEVEELVATAETLASEGFWQEVQSLVGAIGFDPGQQGLVLNGRIVGPIPASATFAHDEFDHLFDYEDNKRFKHLHTALQALGLTDKMDNPVKLASILSLVALSSVSDVPEGIYETPPTSRINSFNRWNSTHSAITVGNPDEAVIQVVVAIDPASEIAQRWIPILKVLSELDGVSLQLFMNPKERLEELPIKRFYRHVLESKPSFDKDGAVQSPSARFTDLPADALLNVAMDVPPSWLVAPKHSIHDLDNIKISSLKDGTDIEAVYELENILIEGHSRDVTSGTPPRGAQLLLGTAKNPHFADTLVMANLGYFQFKANPGFWKLELKEGRSQQIFNIDSAGTQGYNAQPGDESKEIELLTFQGNTIFPRVSRKAGQEQEDVLEEDGSKAGSAGDYLSKGLKFAEKILGNAGVATQKKHADINIFSVASGHLYERMLNIMMVSVMKHTKHAVKFWFIEQFLSPSFKVGAPTVHSPHLPLTFTQDFIPVLAAEYGFEYEMVTYKWPHWLRGQKEKQREIWGYKILFLDVLFPLSLDKVIFVDADQIVRTDMYELVQHDLRGAPYGFTPMCDSRTEMEGFRFWKQGYWANFLHGAPYHISALYVVDLRAFRQVAAGDRLRQHYQQLSADPASLSNLDQDLPNHMQSVLPIHSLPQEWLWCETWCSDEALASARTIDLCNNPLTKEPKLDRARRQVPEWTEYDDAIEAVRRRHLGEQRGQHASESVPDEAATETDALPNTKSRKHQETQETTRDEL